jgi:carboxypeptidase Taq
MEPKLEELKQRLAEINDLRSAASVLNWDQMTYMPPGGAAARGRQVATLEQIAHEKFTHPSIGRMLTELRSLERTFPADSDEAALIRVARRDYDRAVKVPPAFVAKFSAPLERD